jgi:hypothetical protein
MRCWLCARWVLLRFRPARNLVGCTRQARRARACGRPTRRTRDPQRCGRLVRRGWRLRACGRLGWWGLGRPSRRRLGGWTKCLRFRRGPGVWLVCRSLRGRGRLGGLGTGVRSRYRSTARPTTANQPVACPTARLNQAHPRAHPTAQWRCRLGRGCRGWCSWAGRRVGRTAGWLGGTGCCRPRTATRCRRPWAHSPRTGTRRCAVRSAVVRAERVVWIPRAEWTGCRSATSGRPLGSPSSGVCTGRCRTRTLFRCSLQSRAPTTFLIVEVALTSRLTGAPQERPAT